MGRENIDEEALKGEQKGDDFRKLPICQQLRELASFTEYMYSLGAIVGLYFSVSGVQYWMTNYLVVILDFKESDAQLAFGCICATAPLIGTVISAKVCYSLGGHN